MNRSRHLLSFLLIAATICARPVSAKSWLDVLSHWINFAPKEEPGHPYSDQRIPLDLHIADIATAVHNEISGAHEDLFGQPRNFKQGDMSIGAHPRILFSSAEWETMTAKYAVERDTQNHWYKAFLDYSQNKGPGNPLLQKWAAMDTSAYTGEPDMDKDKLKILADEVELMGEYHAVGFFMCALHATVNEKYAMFNGDGYLPESQGMSMAINVIVNYAKILLSHYATYACDECYKYGMMYSDLWSTFRKWSVTNDWLTGGLGIALSYDVLYDRMNDQQRRFVRSAIAVMVTGRQHWGITDKSNAYSPNAVEHQHRIFSNWATYHANLFLTNLAIEGETQFDTIVSNVLINGQPAGFDWTIHNRSVGLYDAFMKHSIYPEGSSFEDGYMYSLAFREGSFALIALAKRGINHIDTQRFRNFMYNSAQMHEPFRCGHFIGHSSGGGVLYPASYAFFRYAYPDSELNQMMWAQRMGLDFSSDECRIWWHQAAIQMAVMGMDHPEGMLHDSPAGLPQSLKQHFDLSIYHARRGILVARTDYSDGALYFHFDARPDSIVVGHDNADRGVITLSALGRTWLDELPWRDFFVSQVHSLMHVDGQAQGVKAPAVRMLKVSDENGVVLAAADLTYAYNTRYAQAWSTADPPFHWEFEFIDGKPEERQIVYSEKETGNIKDFGWPKGDDSSDIGFMDDTKMFDEADIGFSGIYTWKRKYRQVSLLHAVRSTALVRSNRGSSYVIVGDDFAMSGSGKHSFEMYLILAPGVAISNSSKCDTQPCVCKTKPCTIQLDGGESTFLTVHASTLGDQVSYSIEPIEDTGSSRLIIASGGSNFEKFCTVLHPHEDVTGSSKISVRRTAHNVCAVREEGAPTERAFRFMDENHTFETYTIPFVDISGQPAYEPPSPAPTSPPPSPSAAASSKPTVSATPTKSSVLYVSPTPSKSALPKQSATPTPDPVEEVGGGGDDDGWDGSDWDDDGAWEDDGWGDDYDSWGDDDDDWGDDDDDDAWGDDDDWGGDGFYGGGGAGAGTYPLDAWLLQKAAKTDYYEEELVLGKDQFYSPTASYKAELGLYVTADGTSEKRTITTCFPETTAITQITVWNCGHPDYAHDTFYYRDCTEISRDAAAGTHEGCENKDVFTFQEEQNSMYFIVVGADRKGSTRMDFAIKYE